MIARRAMGAGLARGVTVVALAAAAMTTPVAPSAEAAVATGASAWGSNAYGQIGDGTLTTRKTPTTAHRSPDTNSG